MFILFSTQTKVFQRSEHFMALKSSDIIAVHIRKCIVISMVQKFAVIFVVYHTKIPANVLTNKLLILLPPH